jgi:hypothetical protein
MLCLCYRPPHASAEDSCEPPLLPDNSSHYHRGSLAASLKSLVATGATEDIAACSPSPTRAEPSRHAAFVLLTTVSSVLVYPASAALTGSSAPLQHHQSAVDAICSRVLSPVDTQPVAVTWLADSSFQV